MPTLWHPRSDDELIAYTLVMLWALTTGRKPRIDVPPTRLRAQELVDFWSDPAFGPDQP